MATNFSFKILMFSMAVLLVTTEAKMLPSTTANMTRESRQMVFLYPNLALQKAVQAPSLHDEIHDFELEPRRLQGSSSADERFFGGLSNILNGQRLQCPACPSCPNCQKCTDCPACTACPAPCPGTTNAANPLIISIGAAGACTDSGNVAATAYGPNCIRVSAAPSGSFTVSNTVAAGPNIATGFIGIITTCPNTRVTVTCGPIPQNFQVLTQSLQTIGGAAATPGGGVLVETGGFVQVMVRLLNTAGPASVTCSWSSTP